MTRFPNPGHYSDESALNRQMMGEDYRANQERFREAPKEKKEEEMVNPIITDPDEVVRILSDYVNVGMGGPANFAEALGKEHRTIQQGVTRLFVAWMKKLHESAGGNYDARNEASVMLARAMFENIDPEKLHLPLI